MLNRICQPVLIGGLLLVIVAVAAGLPQATQAAERKLSGDEIRAELRVSPQEDKGFVDYVLAKVDRGEISRKTLNEAFLWAKGKSTNRFQYFKRAIMVLSKRR